ncbi:hypothetical protein M9458_045929, partial [Cirrhinus mrigala]
ASERERTLCGDSEGGAERHGRSEGHRTRRAPSSPSAGRTAHTSAGRCQANWAHKKETLQQNAEMDKVRLERLNDEIQQKEEMLQEARMEREKAVVELGREKDCNR